MGCFLTPMMTVLPPPDNVLSNLRLWGRLQNHWHFDKMSTSVHWQEKINKWPQDHEDQKQSKTVCEIFMNIIVFKMLSAHTAFQRKSIVFTTHITKQLPNSNSHIHNAYHKFVPKLCQQWLPGRSQNAPQINEIQVWNPKVSHEVSLSRIPGSSKWLPRDQEWSRSSRWPLTIPERCHAESKASSQPQCQPTACSWKGNQRHRRSLKIFNAQRSNSRAWQNNKQAPDPSTSHQTVAPTII